MVYWNLAYHYILCLDWFYHILLFSTFMKSIKIAAADYRIIKNFASNNGKFLSHAVGEAIRKYVAAETRKNGKQ